MSQLSVSEVFYSIQGEGSTMGYPAVFIRLSGCNLMCGGNGTQRDKKLHDGATWRCDTIEVWMKGTKTNFEDILNERQTKAVKHGAHIIVTGGEPLLQQEQMIRFMHWVRDNINPDAFFEIETNGTKAPLIDLLTLNPLFNCSPKLRNSGMPEERRIVPHAIQAISKANSIFKFVVSNLDDIYHIHTDYGGIIDPRKIWIMPAGETQEELNKSKVICAELCKAFNYKLSTRMHIEIWDKKTGV